MYIQANIGRNSKNVPMSDTAWLTFQRDVKDEIFLAVHDVDIPLSFEISMDDFQIHAGMGEWDGVTEESAHVSIYFDTKPGQVNAARVHDHLGDALADLAQAYGQDAIAFVVTDSHLAEAR